MCIRDRFEHDACGIGAVVDIKGRKSHQTVDDALAIVERLEHRAGKDAEGKMCIRDRLCAALLFSLNFFISTFMSRVFSRWKS